MMTLSAGMRVALQAVFELGPAGFAQLEVELPMCERIAASHLKRLQRHGLVEYAQGLYSITEEGKERLVNG